MPRPYSLNINFPQLSPCCPLYDVILYSVKRRRSVQKPLRSKMRFEFRQ